MTTTEALDHLASRLVQTEKDIKLLEDSADVAKTERDLLRKDLDIVISVLTKVVEHVHETRHSLTLAKKTSTTKRKHTIRRV